MLTVRDLLTSARAAQSLPSNYALAKLLQVRENDVSRWHNGRNIPAPAMVVRLAQLAQLDPAEVLPAIEAQRAGDEAVRAAWARAAQRLQLAGLAACAVILSLWIGGGPDGGALLALGALAVPIEWQSAFYTLCAVAAVALASRARCYPYNGPLSVRWRT